MLPLLRKLLAALRIHSLLFLVTLLLLEAGRLGSRDVDLDCLDSARDIARLGLG